MKELFNKLMEERGCGCCEGNFEDVLIEIARACDLEPVYVIKQTIGGEYQQLEGFE